METKVEQNLTPVMREIFYNGLVEGLTSIETNADNIEANFKLQIKTIIAKTLYLSLNYDSGKTKGGKGSEPSIQLPGGLIITAANCPKDYLDFFKALIFIKQNKELEEMNDDYHFFPSTHNSFELFSSVLPASVNIVIDKLATRLMAEPSFQAMLPTLTEIITGVCSITPEKMRMAFYNGMVEQVEMALIEQIISLEDIQGDECYLFLALPAFTIIAAIMRSLDIDGIRLTEADEIVTQENCPQSEDFPALLEQILIAKQKIIEILDESIKEKEEEKEKEEKLCPSDIKLQVIKYLCISDDKPMPEEIGGFKTEKIKTTQITGCAAVVNNLATILNSRDVFRKTIMKVLEVFAEPTFGEYRP